MSRLPPALAGPWAFLLYLSSFLACLVGAAGVLLVMAGILLADLAVGIARRDLKQRLRRGRF